MTGLTLGCDQIGDWLNDGQIGGFLMSKWKLLDDEIGYTVVTKLDTISNVTRLNWRNGWKTRPIWSHMTKLGDDQIG
jgi:hypothetical protein